METTDIGWSFNLRCRTIYIESLWYRRLNLTHRIQMTVFASINPQTLDSYPVVKRRQSICYLHPTGQPVKIIFLTPNSLTHQTVRLLSCFPITKRICERIETFYAYCMHTCLRLVAMIYPYLMSIMTTSGRSTSFQCCSWIWNFHAYILALYLTIEISHKVVSDWARWIASTWWTSATSIYRATKACLTHLVWIAITCQANRESLGLVHRWASTSLVLNEISLNESSWIPAIRHRWAS